MNKLLMFLIAASGWTVLAGGVPENFRADAAKYWKLDELKAPPAYRPSPFAESDAPNMKALLVTGRGPKRSVAEFFCYYAVPSTPKPEKGYPCVLLLHGGGGTAFSNYVEHYRTNGFAVLALDWYNSRPLPDKEAPLLKGGKSTPLEGGKRNDHFVNVANMVLANSLLRSMPEVNPEKNVFVGLSWGSWYGAAVAAVDDRFNGFVEIYCGDINPFDGRLVDGRFLHQAKKPMWWVTWTQDQNVNPLSSQLGWDDCPTYWGHMTTTKLGHSHQGFRLPSVMRMAKYFAGEGSALPRLGKPTLKDGVLSAELIGEKPTSAALTPHLTYTLDVAHDMPRLSREKRVWEVVPASFDGKTVSAPLPLGTVVAYLSLCENDDPNTDLGGASHYWFCPTASEYENPNNVSTNNPLARTLPRDIVKRGYALPYSFDYPFLAQPWERTAVSELQSYLAQLATNGVVTVDGKNAVFHVGDTAFAREHQLGAADLKDEEWVVKSFGGDVVLAGGGTRGTLYAVWHFLEDACGVRWWNDDDEDVPVAGELKLSAQDRHGKPFFLCRDVFRARDSSRWAEARNRLNGAGAAPMPPELGGACTYGPPYHCHTFRRMLPFEKYGKDHPEWFAIYQGKRTGGGDFGGQPCLTHPEVRKHCAACIEKYIAEGETAAEKKGLPKPLMYDVSQNDSSKFCECDACRAAVEKLGLSGLVIDFVKDVTREAAAKHPELLFSTLAYSRTEPLPKEGVTVPDNFIIKLCNTKQNMAAGVFDETNAKWRGYIDGWRKLSKNLFVWEYVPTYGKFGEGFPLSNEFYLAEKYRYYADNNVTGFLIEHEKAKGYETQDMYALKFWVLAHLLEDPYQDGEKLIVAFMDGYYGPAGAKILAARRHLAKIARERKANVFWFPFAADFDFIKPADVKLMSDLFDEAAALVKNDPKRTRRVAVARMSVERIREAQSAGGGLHPAEAGVSDVPFYEMPVTEKFFKLWDSFSFWQDPDIGDPAAGGAAVVRLTKPEENLKHFSLPFKIGLYNQGTKKSGASRDIKQPKGEGYHWYDLDHVKLPEESAYIYFTRSWGIQEYLTNAELKGKTVKIRALIKFQGPLYLPGSTEPNEIRLARVVFIPYP